MKRPDLKYPPGPKPVKSLPGLLRFAGEFNRDSIGFISDGFREYGDLHRFEIMGGLQYQLAHPDHLRRVLVEEADKFAKDSQYTDDKRGLARFIGSGLLTSNGDFWKRQRKLMTPAFHHQRIVGYASTMTRHTAAMLDRWTQRTPGTLNIDAEMMHTTLLIVVEALFGADLSEESIQRVGDAMATLDDFSASMNLLPTWVPTPLELRVRRALRELDSVIYPLIHERRAAGELRHDLLATLIEAETEDGERMSDKQIRDELVTLFLAGHDTTANTLNWTFYLLAQNPRVEARLHEELDSVLGGQTPTVEDLKRLPYAEMIIKESMRLFPPAFAFSRVALEDVEVGGYIIPTGATVGIMSCVTHRDPRWWGDDAADFVPERWMPEREKLIPRYAYLPFGGGPRVCIGNMFAMMEAQLLLSMIASRYTLRLHPGQVVERSAKLTLSPKNGLPMIVTQRVTQGVMPRPAEQAPQAEPLLERT
jgi:cytochrome P450